MRSWLLSDWMQNAGATLTWHELGVSLPVTCSHPTLPKAPCFITSPKIGWFDYAALETQHRPGVSWALGAMGRLADVVGLSHQCVVANYPVSTNVWTPAELKHIPALCERVVQDQPKRFVFVRNVHAQHHTELRQQLKTLGFYALPARVVYEFDLRDAAPKKSSQLMRDMKGRQQLELQSEVLTAITPQEAAQIKALYDLIYVLKHGPFNAQYTPHFFADMVNTGSMKCLVLRSPQGHIRAFALLYQVARTLTVPALGYALDDEGKGLYRALFVDIYRYTLAHKLLLNFSSGAGDFKRKRGGQPHLEYTLVKPPLSCLNWKAQLFKCLERSSAGLSHEDLMAWGA